MKETKDILRELREDGDLSQREVAKLLGISQQYYSKYEAGEHELPLRHLRKLMDFYHVSADYILGRGMSGRRLELERTDLDNIYVMYGCSCKTLLENIMRLDEEGREAVVRYVQLQNYRMQLLGSEGK